MRSAGHCLAKAIEMDATAAVCNCTVASADYTQMAMRWRELAKIAAWQDRWTAEHSDWNNPAG